MHLPHHPTRQLLILGAVALAASCGSQSGGGGASGAVVDAASGPPLPWPALAMPAVPIPADNPASDAKATLGRLLFHDPILSSDQTVACVTCHSQYWGMGDGLPFSIGVGGTGPAGVGRTGPTHTLRNARSLWNAAYRERLFWDGSAASLEDQVLVPIASPIELNRDVNAIVTDLAAIPAYVEAFQAAFPGDPNPVRVDTLQKAIAAFVRTVISVDAPYDEYVRGDPNAISPDEVRGMFLFADLGCPSCHTPPRFESERYGDAGIRTAGVDDLGRYDVTMVAADRYAMRVPTLRNLRETGPYFHDGSATAISDAVTLMVGVFGTRAATADEIAAVTTFLTKSLVDLSASPERPVTVPSGLPVPQDGLEITR